MAQITVREAISQALREEMYRDERLINKVKSISELSALEIIKTVHQEGSKFAGSGRLDDDFTLLCIKRLD